MVLTRGVKHPLRVGNDLNLLDVDPTAWILDLVRVKSDVEMLTSQKEG